uniref:Uncharacterized protein n=1 Tax=Corethron hystrix TaxID=216773 RepID=A0A6U5EP61_9STRA
MVSEYDCVDPACPTPVVGMEVTIVVVFPRDFDRDAGKNGAVDLKDNTASLPPLFPEDDGSDSDDDSESDDDNVKLSVYEPKQSRDQILASLPIPENYSYKCNPVGKPMAEVTEEEMRLVIPVWLGGKYEEGVFEDDDGGAVDGNEMAPAPENVIPATGNFVFKRGGIAASSLKTTTEMTMTTATDSTTSSKTTALSSGVAWRQRQKMNNILQGGESFDCLFKQTYAGSTRPRGCPCCDPDDPSNVLDMSIMM